MVTSGRWHSAGGWQKGRLRWHSAGEYPSRRRHHIQLDFSLFYLPVLRSMHAPYDGDSRLWKITVQTLEKLLGEQTRRATLLSGIFLLLRGSGQHISLRGIPTLLLD